MTSYNCEKGEGCSDGKCVRKFRIYSMHYNVIVSQKLCLVQNIVLLILACGDHLETIASNDWTDQIKLGTVDLQNGDTYLSCRKLCRDAYPDFQYYHKFKLYQSCDCMKISTGFAISLKDHEAYTFGYSTECGTFTIL